MIIASDRTNAIIALLVFVIALMLRLLLVAPTGFDGLYGQDSYAYYAFALDLRRALSHGQMPPPFFWSLGYPSLLAAGTALFGSSARVGQWMNIFMGAGCAALTFVLALQIGCGRAASGFAGLIAACSGQSLQSSIVLMSDIPALFWSLLSVSALLQLTRANRQNAKNARGDPLGRSPLHTCGHPWSPGVSLTVCLLALTCAVLTRWLCLALAPPILLVLLMQRPPLRHMVIALSVISPLIALQAAHSATSPYPTLDHPWLTGWSPEHYFQTTFDTPDGHAEYPLINLVFYAQPVFNTPYLIPLLTPFVLRGIMRVLNRAATSALLIGWPLLPFLFLAGIPYQNIRFPLIMLPPVAILCARGIEISARWRKPSVFFFSGLLNKLFTLFLLVSLLLLAGEGITYTQAFIARQMRDTAVVFWVRDHLPVDATLYTHGLSPALRHHTQMEIHELYDETPQSLSTARYTSAYLLINGWQIARQWAGLPPAIAVDWLLEHRTLRRIGHMNDYTLYLVSP